MTPEGEIVAHPGRGTLMGNRGCLHDERGALGVARWRSPLWICCVLEWKGIRRDPMPPGRWTALFFLDEATALAAGHRPCALCRRDAYRAFTSAWQRAHGLAAAPRAAELDARLHAERVEPRTRRQRTRPATAGALPDGAMVRRDGAPALVIGGSLARWSFDGYAAPERVAAATAVELLTPPATVAALAAGYRPLLHPTAPR